MTGHCHSEERSDEEPAETQASFAEPVLSEAKGSG
jgi:hypothetical protein